MTIIGANTHQPQLPHRVTLSRSEGSVARGSEMLRGVYTERSECVWITYIVTWSGPAHRSQASLRGAATRGRKTALGGLRCADPPGVTMWVIRTRMCSAGQCCDPYGFLDQFVKPHYRPSLDFPLSR